MNKKSGFISGAGKGLATGAGISAALVMAREFIRSIEDAKAEKKRKNPHTDTNTIVINLPKSKEVTASARDSFKDVPACESKIVDMSTPDRDKKGRYTPHWLSKKAQQKLFPQTIDTLVHAGANIKSHAGDITGAVIGGSLGYLLVRRIADNLEKKRLEREIAEAQQEYVNMLHKKSEYDILEPFSRHFTKQAQDASEGTIPVRYYGDPWYSRLGGWAKDTARQGLRSAGRQISEGAIEPLKPIAQAVSDKADATVAKGVDASQWLTGGAAATTILLSLVTAYVTKKMFERKFGNSASREKAMFSPKQTRILFKTSSDLSDEIKPETALASIYLIKKAMSWAPESISKQAQVDTNDRLFDSPPANPATPQAYGISHPPVRGSLGFTPQTQAVIDRASGAAPRPQSTYPQSAATPAPAPTVGPTVAAENTLPKVQPPPGLNQDYVKFLSNPTNFSNIMDYLSSGQLSDEAKVWGIVNMKTLNALKGLSDSDKQAYLGAALRANKGLIPIMNQDKYSPLISSYADQAVQNYFGEKAKAYPWLANSGFGRLLQALTSWFLNRTGLGRQLRQQRILQLGQEKTSQDLSMLAALVKDDSTNEDTMAKVKELLSKLDASKTEDGPAVSVATADATAKEYAKKKRAQIMQAIEELHRKYQ